MIPIEVCKKLLNQNKERHFNKEEIEEIRSFLYLMATLQLEEEENNLIKKQQ